MLTKKLGDGAYNKAGKQPEFQNEISRGKFIKQASSMVTRRQVAELELHRIVV